MMHFYRVRTSSSPKFPENPLHRKIYEVGGDIVRDGQNREPGVDIKTILPPTPQVGDMTWSQLSRPACYPRPDHSSNAEGFTPAASMTWPQRLPLNFDWAETWCQHSLSCTPTRHLPPGHPRIQRGRERRPVRAGRKKPGPLTMAGFSQFFFSI